MTKKDVKELLILLSPPTILVAFLILLAYLANKYSN